MGHKNDNGVMTIEGIYTSGKLKIMNPPVESMVGFCIYEIQINGSIVTSELNNELVEWDFKNYLVYSGDKITIKIKHKKHAILRF